MAETSDLQGQRKLRLSKLQKLQELGINPFPTRGNRTHSNQELLESYEEQAGKTVSVVGRIMAVRGHGKLKFMDVRDRSAKIQVYAKEEEFNQRDIVQQLLGFEDLALLDQGDFIEATGTLVTTQSGEISVEATKIKLLTKSIRPLPTKLEDKEERYRRRYLDMTLHPEVRDRFERRSKFWNAIRSFLNKNGFLEINIPVLEHTTGGADAKPFVTHYDALNQDFYLRISHELPLKRLLGAGYEKVYDIGPRFRNEGFSDEHLPEHVAMEWYWAYADYRDGMQLTKEMFRFVMQEVYGTLQFNMRGFEVDLNKEWVEMDYLTLMNERYGVDPLTEDLDKLNQILKDNGVDLGENPNRSRVVDSLWKLIRKTIAGPAFLVGVPTSLSPLAKMDPNNPAITQRFHPIIAGSELSNAFSELNDPVDQLNRFLEQQDLRTDGDEEAHMLDIDFVEMLEYGMPPAVGFGLSERVFWFFENVTAKEGIPFPQLKMDVDNTTKQIYPEVDFSHLHTSNDKQDFDHRVAVIVDANLEGWQSGNAIAHMSAYIGHKLESRFDTGEHFVGKDGMKYPRNTQYPIIIFSANSVQIKELLNKAKEGKLMHHAFIREMIETTNDAKITTSIADKAIDQVDVLGVAIFGDNDHIKQLTQGLELMK